MYCKYLCNEWVTILENSLAMEWKMNWGSVRTVRHEAERHLERVTVVQMSHDSDPRWGTDVEASLMRWEQTKQDKNKTKQNKKNEKNGASKNG